MLMVIVPSILLILTIWVIPFRQLWSMSLTYSVMIFMISLKWFCNTMDACWYFATPYLATDWISTPLLILTCWLLPLMILASQHHMASEPENRQRMYITLLVSLQVLLLLSFSTTDLMMFYVMFEATLIPTLIIITRWGSQEERLKAGAYFLFYTLMGSLPLLVAILALLYKTGTLSLLTLRFVPPIPLESYTDKMWWAGCLIAFLVKMPLYGVHLWLPKAHVEAPVAGSMILAAILLKLGGYGMMRITMVLQPLNPELTYPLIIIALWGVVMTGAICLRQGDLKALIAYSSVGHMGLVAAGILIQTPWGFSGAIVLMIAHGLTSSALFCLANTSYERTHSRMLLLTRGFQVALPMMTTWWFLAVLANIALPPLPNLLGELMIISSLYTWAPETIILTGAGTLFTVAYSMYMFMKTQRGPLPKHTIAVDPPHTREHLLMALHLFPIILLILKPELIWGSVY
uniref:NADH-ubiquinone oxidoreductase chain 4 n=1 Tax=Moolgarda cunnesius TaxID=1111463 RepID=I1T2I4_MOOCU|nr:NADH dehydrogenase subunit 4 [Moolgarda cunnesius]AEK53206.2 NADH dehydrogenase subunit 4 [Moolgarda cunnesius]